MRSECSEGAGHGELFPSVVPVLMPSHDSRSTSLRAGSRLCDPTRGANRVAPLGSGKPSGMAKAQTTRVRVGRYVGASLDQARDRKTLTQNEEHSQDWLCHDKSKDAREGPRPLHVVLSDEVFFRTFAPAIGS
jgi:hypothetical protein